MDLEQTSISLEKLREQWEEQIAFWEALEAIRRTKRQLAGHIGAIVWDDEHFNGDPGIRAVDVEDTVYNLMVNRHKPVSVYIGITSCPIWRWTGRSTDESGRVNRTVQPHHRNYDELVVLFHGPHARAVEIERGLITFARSTAAGIAGAARCNNKHPGGEGMSDNGCATFVYCCVRYPVQFSNRIAFVN